MSMIASRLNCLYVNRRRIKWDCAEVIHVHVTSNLQINRHTIYNIVY